MTNQASQHDPARRKQRAPDDALTGEALQLEICRLREIEGEDDKPKHSFAAIARMVGCSRAYVAKVCAAPIVDEEKYPAEVFAALLEHLRSGSREDVLAIPGLVELLPVRDPNATPEQAARLRRASLTRRISYGRGAEEGSQKRALYDARQAGKAARAKGGA